MYVPIGIANCFELINEKYGHNILVRGRLSCCGQYSFHIKYLGDLKANIFGHYSIFHKHDDAVIMSAKCIKCGKIIRVFNSYTDGYDNCVDKSQPLISSKQLNDFSCPACFANCYSLEISYEYLSKEELEEDGIEQYENAFTWIWVSLRCVICEKIFKNLIDMETA